MSENLDFDHPQPVKRPELVGSKAKTFAETKKELFAKCHCELLPNM